METNDTKNEIQLLTAKQLGAKMNLSKRQIFRLNSCQKLPAPIRIGGSVRWSVEELRDFIAARNPATGRLPSREQWLQIQESQKCQTS